MIKYNLFFKFENLIFKHWIKICKQLRNPYYEASFDSIWTMVRKYFADQLCNLILIPKQKFPYGLMLNT